MISPEISNEDAKLPKKSCLELLRQTAYVCCLAAVPLLARAVDDLHAKQAFAAKAADGRRAFKAPTAGARLSQERALISMPTDLRARWMQCVPPRPAEGRSIAVFRNMMPMLTRSVLHRTRSANTAI